MLWLRHGTIRCFRVKSEINLSSVIFLFLGYVSTKIRIARVTLKHDGTDGTSNCFEEDVRIVIVQNGTDGMANSCASCA